MFYPRHWITLSSTITTPTPPRHPGFHSSQRGTHSYWPLGFSGGAGALPEQYSPVFIRSGPSGIGIFPGRKYGREQQFVIFPSFLPCLRPKSAWTVAMNRGAMPWEAGSADYGVRVPLLSLLPGPGDPSVFCRRLCPCSEGSVLSTSEESEAEILWH